MELFDFILNTNNAQEAGNMQGIQYGIVADVSDPLGLQRVQVYDQAKGGNHKSGWLMRGLPFTSFSPPVPKLDDLVIFGYIMGDPHHGCYLGCIVNNVNKPVGADADFTILLGKTKVTIIAATGNTEVVTDSGKVSITTKSGNIAVTSTDGNITATTTNGNVEMTGKTISLTGTTAVTITAPTVTLATSNAKVAGKDIVAVGGVDSRGDTIVNKGY